MLLLAVWCVVVACALVLLGQWAGLIDSGVVRQVVAFMPITSGVDGSATRPTVAAPAPTPGPAAANAGGQTTTVEICTPERPGFVHGAATLKSALGQRMGEALECERGVDATGDTEQRTTTGLVYYRAATNAVVFTNGWDHWGLAANGVVHWTGDEVDPPPRAERFK
jgi:hypothetical protein